MSPDPMLLDVRGAEKSFGATNVLAHVDFAVRPGEFVSLLGPSGCGKTTLLRIIAGLITADRGSVKLDGVDITRLPTHKRGVGVVFQSYALFPHLTVAENVAFGLKAQGTDAATTKATVARYLDLVHLTAMADRPIRGLSGGQQQRVAVARALAVQPKLLLLDEPFSALDRKLRDTMQVELRHLLRDVGITAVLVTHDQEEALVMSDRIAVMNKGAIEQFATPDEIYLRPGTPFALGFVGHSTRIPGTASDDAGDGTMMVDTALGRLRVRGRFIKGAPVLVAVRPERIGVGEAPSGDANTVTARLTDVVFKGSKVHMHLTGPGDPDLLVETSQLAAGLSPGAEVTLSWPVADTLVFPREAA